MEEMRAIQAIYKGIALLYVIKKMRAIRKGIKLHFKFEQCNKNSYISYRENNMSHTRRWRALFHIMEVIRAIEAMHKEKFHLLYSTVKVLYCQVFQRSNFWKWGIYKNRPQDLFTTKDLLYYLACLLDLRLLLYLYTFAIFPTSLSTL